MNITAVLNVHTKYSPGDQIETNEMGGVCSMYWRGKRCIQDFGGET
jgi:hypothetical protein